METNFLIIMVVTIIGMSIPIVICCLFFSVCDPIRRTTTTIKIPESDNEVSIDFYDNESRQ